MRGRMNDSKSYAEPVAIGAPMVGGTVARVVTSDVKGLPLVIGSLALVVGRITQFRMGLALRIWEPILRIRPGRLA